MALFAPIPNASERIATLANSGLRRRPRIAYRRSAQKVLIGRLTGLAAERLSSAACRAALYLSLSAINFSILAIMAADARTMMARDSFNDTSVGRSNAVSLVSS